jgi:hypothetical protein
MIMDKLRFPVFVGLLLALVSGFVFAAATTQAVSGQVTMAPAKGEYAPLVFGQRVESGASIKTGSNGRVILRFDDGQMVSITEGSLFVVTEYKFNAHKPQESSFFGSLVKGGMRAVTGAIGEANKNNVMIKTPVATVGIRGTDFQLFVENKLYINLLSGAIAVTNNGGSTVFDEKSPSGLVADAESKAVAAPVSSFPAAAQAAFRIQQNQPLMGPVKDPNPQDPTCKDR